MSFHHSQEPRAIAPESPRRDSKGLVNPVRCPSGLFWRPVRGRATWESFAGAPMIEFWVPRELPRDTRACMVQLDHYVFPACEAGHIDPSRSQSSWRTAWRNMRAAAGLPKLRFHDLRHHAITELAESQASDSTVMSIAGHVSPKMLAHYSHVRVDAKRKALDSLASRQNTSRPQGYDTKNDTNPTFAAESNSATSTQVPDLSGFNLVELVGIEPTTSSLRTMRSPS